MLEDKYKKISMISGYFLNFIKKLEILDSVAVRLVVITGKSPHLVHPKHLVYLGPLWFERNLQKSDVVLDLGCDMGIHTLKTSKKVKKIVGIDYQTSNIEVAKEMAQIQKIRNAAFVLGSLEKKLEFPSDSFDKVLFLDVLEHLNKRSQIMGEVFRVLRKNGLLLLSIPNSETSWKKLLRKNSLNSFADTDHKKEYTKTEAVKVCTKAGFRVISIDPITLDTPIAPVISLVGGISLSLYRKLLNWKKGKIRQHPENTVGFRIVAQKI